MKCTVLSDNRTSNSHLQTEHGLSIFLETATHRILLDTGASDVFLLNAERMGIDLSTVDMVFISHGHSDHAGGLRYLMKMNSQAKVIVSPHAVSGKFFSKRTNLHSITPQWPERMLERFLFVDETSEVVEGVSVIAHILQQVKSRSQFLQTYPLPRGNTHLFVVDADGNYANDEFRHELALYTEGLLFTGCAHNGLENILAACSMPVNTVVGGFHLLDGYEKEEDVIALGKRLAKSYPQTRFYTSHCTGDTVFETLKMVMGDQLQAFSCGTVITDK